MTCRYSWTAEEDQAIRQLVEEYGLLNWTQIESKLKELDVRCRRSGKQCRQRWYNHLSPKVNKKPWTSREESLIFEMHKVSGNRWKEMSQHFDGRTDNDIKNHFYSTLRRSLRRLNKYMGSKNSTSQMREIKPSVLSTILNYVYQNDNHEDRDILQSLKDLPYLIFQFANKKPSRGGSIQNQDEDKQISRKVRIIFKLINDFQNLYVKIKKLSNENKTDKKVANSELENPRQTTKSDSLMKYLPIKKCHKGKARVDKATAAKSESQNNLKVEEKTSLITITTTKKEPRKAASFVKKNQNLSALEDELGLPSDYGLNTYDNMMLSSSEKAALEDGKCPDVKVEQEESDPNESPVLNRRLSRMLSLQAQDEEDIEREMEQIEQPSQSMGFQGLFIVGKKINIPHQFVANEQAPRNVPQENINELIELHYDE